MAYKYQFVRKEAWRFDDQGNVVSFVFGLKAWDPNQPDVTAYIDGECEVPEDMRKPLDQWTYDEIMALAREYAETVEEGPPMEEGGEPEILKPNWFDHLDKQLEAKVKRSKPQPINLGDQEPDYEWERDRTRKPKFKKEKLGKKLPRIRLKHKKLTRGT